MQEWQYPSLMAAEIMNGKNGHIMKDEHAQ